MNTSNSILLIDPAFEPALSAAYVLLVKVGLHDFSYAIIDQAHQKVIAVYDEQECESGFQKLLANLKTDPYLGQAYQEVRIAFHTPHSISIPNELFDGQSTVVHSKFFDESPSATVYTQTQPHYGLTTIFALPAAMVQAASSFTNAKVYQQDAGLLLMAKNAPTDSLFLDFAVGTFQLLYIKNNQVVFQQSYEIEHIDEFNYYLILAINQLNIDTKNTTLNLSGIVHQGDAQYTCLAKYFDQINFTILTVQLDQAILDELPLHYYSNLLALSQCVS